MNMTLSKEEMAGFYSPTQRNIKKNKDTKMDYKLKDTNGFAFIKSAWDGVREKTLITHTDMDGFGCRYMARRHTFKNIIHVDYVDSDKIIKKYLASLIGTTVFLSDFSPSDETLELFKKNGIEWYLIDHHRSTQDTKDKYPENVWLETDICSTEQMYVLNGENDEDTLVAELIGIGDLFRDEDADFWAAREMTMTLKKIYDMLEPFLPRKHLFNSVSWCINNMLGSINGDIMVNRLTPGRVEELSSSCIKSTLARVTGGNLNDAEDKSTTQLLLDIECKMALTSKGAIMGDTLFVDDLFRNNFSSMSKMIFDIDRNLKYVVKIGVNGSLSARGSKHYPDADVTLLNNDIIKIRGHKMAGGGKVDNISLPIGNSKAMIEAIGLFKKE